MIVPMKVDGRKIDDAKLEEIRFAVVTAIQGGMSASQAARDYGVNIRRVFEWLALYRAGGWDALRSSKATGRPKKLTAKQIKWIYDTVTMKSPLQVKLPFALWTRAQIKTLIRREFGLSLSLTSIGRLLAQLGLTCQRPLFRAYEQNPSLVDSWLKADYPKIRAMAKRENAEIFFEDESGLRSDYHSGTTWGKRGETPIVRATGKRFRLNMISAVSPRGELHFKVIREGVNAETFIEFLKSLMHNRRRPVFLIVDGHPSHRSKSVKEYVDSLDGKLRLFFLPPYSPELNPDELVWNHVKNHTIGKMVFHTVEELVRSVRAHLRKIQRAPELIRSFFRAPETSYAAWLPVR
jgi:transposase